MKLTEEDYARLDRFEVAFMDRIRELKAFEDAGDAESERLLGLEISDALLNLSPVELTALVMIEASCRVVAEARVLDLEASITSWQNPQEIPPGPVADQINYFLLHPETGVRRDLPARRGVQVGDNLKQINVFNESKEIGNV